MFDIDGILSSIYKILNDGKSLIDTLFYFSTKINIFCGMSEV